MMIGDTLTEVRNLRSPGNTSLTVREWTKSLETLAMVITHWNAVSIRNRLVEPEDLLKQCLSGTQARWTRGRRTDCLSPGP